MKSVSDPQKKFSGRVFCGVSIRDFYHYSESESVLRIHTVCGARLGGSPYCLSSHWSQESMPKLIRCVRSQSSCIPYALGVKIPRFQERDFLCE